MAPTSDQLTFSVGSSDTAASAVAEKDPRSVAVVAAREAAAKAVTPVEVGATPAEQTERLEMLAALRTIRRISGAVINSDSEELQRDFAEFCARHPEVQKTLNALYDYHRETYRHSVGAGFVMMALIKRHPELFEDFTSQEQEELILGAFMHDVGKLIGVQNQAFDAALKVEGRKLTGEEFGLIKMHTRPDVVAGRMDHVAGAGAFDRLSPLTRSTMIGHHAGYNRELAPGAADPKIQKAMQALQIVDVLEAVAGVMGQRGYRLKEIADNISKYNLSSVSGILGQNAVTPFQEQVVTALYDTVRMDAQVEAVRVLASHVAEEGPFPNDAAQSGAYALILQGMMASARLSAPVAPTQMAA